MERGNRFAKYELGEFLGAGGTAEVFAATHVETGERVVIKILLPDLPSEYAARFLRECEILEALSHPNVLKVLTSGKEDGRPFYVMEQHDAITLQRRLDDTFRPGPEAKPPATSQELMHIARQVLDALDYAHGEGVYHRDIKPENVLLDKEGQAYLADFGLALLTDATSITAEGQMLGTLSHMSPEQVKGQKPDGRSDVYQMGILLHEMLVGHLPFPESSNYQSLMRRVQEQVPNPIIHHADLPPSLGDVISKACSPLPEERYETIAAMREALLQENNDFPLPEPQAPQPDVEEEREEEQNEKSGRLPLALAALVVIFLALGAAWSFTRPVSPDYLSEARRHREKGELTRAEQLYRLALTAKDEASLREEMARFFLEQKRPRAAQEILGLSGQSFKSDITIEAWMARAHEQAETSAWSEVSATLAPLVTARPDYSPARLLLAESFINQNEVDEAAKELATLPKEFWIRLSYQATMGRVQLSRGKAEEALKTIQSCQAPDANTAAAEGRAYTNILELRSEIFASLKRPEDEAAALKVVLKKRPTFANWLRLGKLSEKLRRPLDALRAYAAASRIKPEDPRALPAFYVLAIGLERSLEANLAAFVIRKNKHPFLKSMSQFTRLRNMLTSSRVYNTHTIEALKKLIQDDPNFIPAKHLLSSRRRVSALSVARKELEAIVAESPCYAVAYKDLAQVKQKQGDVAGAIKSLDTALELAPDLIPAVTTYARILTSNGKYKESFALLQIFIDTNPQAFAAYTVLGRYHMRFGSVARAVPLYQALCKLSVTRPVPLDTLGLSDKEVKVVIDGLHNVNMQRYRHHRRIAAGQLQQLRLPVPRPSTEGTKPTTR